MIHTSDIAFTESVKAVQKRKGSRPAYESMEQSGSWESRITPDLRRFIEEQTSAFLATASAAGQPYIQHRGGPAGFLRVLDESTIGFADFSGNRQYITLGNLAENPKAQLFLIDYAQRRRVKLWGQARVEEHDEELIRRLAPEGYKVRAEQAIVLKVRAWDTNCSKHIPQRFDAAEVSAALAERDRRIEELSDRIERLSGAGGSPSKST